MNMKKEEELKMKLADVHYEFKKERFDIALIKLELAGKMIVSSLNSYNKKR